MLGDARSRSELGEELGHGLYRAEVDYLLAEEWATQAEDILWRRTKLGLVCSPEQVAQLQRYLADHPLLQPGRSSDAA
jgi:glycerol-3-phosphate dehydrogenase